jgi:hypothetical protein
MKDLVACTYIGGFPHFLQFEFFDASLVWGDGRALDANLVLLDRLSSLDGDYLQTSSKPRQGPRFGQNKMACKH